MTLRIEIPKFAKITSRKALKLRQSLPVSKRFGLTSEEAKRFGVTSGVNRAIQISKRKYISEFDAEKVISFHNRFKNCKTPKCKGAINLWGGKLFYIYLKEQLNKK